MARKVIIFFPVGGAIPRCVSIPVSCEGTPKQREKQTSTIFQPAAVSLAIYALVRAMGWVIGGFAAG